MFFKHNFYVNQDDKLANQSYQSFKNYSWRRSYANNSVQIFRLYDRYSSMMDKPIAFFIKYCSEDSSNNYIFKSNGSFSFWTIWKFENEDRNDFYTKGMYKDVEAFYPDFGEAIYPDLLWNAHSYRMNNEEYLNYIEQQMSLDIDSFQQLINDIPLFSSGDLNDITKIEIIKELFVTMYFQSFFLHFSASKYFPERFLLDQRNIFYINNQDELERFIAVLKSDSFPDVPVSGTELGEYHNMDHWNLFDPKFTMMFQASLMEYQIPLIWHYTKENKKYLLSKLNEVRSDFEEVNVIYFYSVPDLRLFRLEINLNDNKEISIKGTYINHQFIWDDFCRIWNSDIFF
ncbi:MAG: hypothetical protein IIA45_12855 [Bacteroidetes bacterium]|nr:hypothetical protein [Bacteroidota bacterium]